MNSGSLLATFKQKAENLFFPSAKPELISREKAETHILAHRFEGKSSIDATIDKRLNRCFLADEKSSQAIELYDNFSHIYQYLIQQLNVFDSKVNPRVI